LPTNSKEIHPDVAPSAIRIGFSTDRHEKLAFGSRGALAQRLAGVETAASEHSRKSAVDACLSQQLRMLRARRSRFGVCSAQQTAAACVVESACPRSCTSHNRPTELSIRLDAGFCHAASLVRIGAKERAVRPMRCWRYLSVFSRRAAVDGTVLLRFLAARHCSCGSARERTVRPMRCWRSRARVLTARNPSTEQSIRAYAFSARGIDCH
jgi:hypothetical protein